MVVSDENYKVLIDNFKRIMKNVLSEKDYNLLQERLEAININFINDIVSKEHEIFGNVAGTFNPDGTINLYDKEERVIYHELLHASSLQYHTDTISYDGFNHQNIDEKKNIGIGLNEGYTELLTIRYFGGDSRYKNEVFYNQMIENIIGKDKMQSLYFNSDLDGLISELSKYCEKSKVLNFVDKMDYFIILDSIKRDKSEKYKDQKVPSFESIRDFQEINEKYEETIHELNQFLIECYASKYKNSSNINEIKENLADYITVHYEDYHFAYTDFDIKSQIEKSFKNKNNDVGGTGKMKSPSVREKELIDSGLVDYVEHLYDGIEHDIPKEYYVLIADYMEALSQVSKENSLNVNIAKIMESIPEKLKTIKEVPLNIYGDTKDKKILMNDSLSYNQRKLYFFHELTHALQTYEEKNGDDVIEHCSFSNDDNGRFLMEGATQYTAQILYNVSNQTYDDMKTMSPSPVRAVEDHVAHSPLSTYQVNGNILLQLSLSMNMPLNEMLGVLYDKDGREKIKQRYESIPGNEGKFEKLMFDMEKIYSLDKIYLTMPQERESLRNGTRIITTAGGKDFEGSFQIESDLISQVERELSSDFLANNETDYVLKNYQMFAETLTKPELKQNFLNGISQIKNAYYQEHTPNVR